MMEKIFNLDKPAILLGNKFSEDLDVLLTEFSIKRKRIILVIGERSFAKTEFYSQLRSVFEKNDLIVIKEIRVKKNPTEENIFKEGVDCSQADVVFCVGGGSVIDFGKAIKLRYCLSAKIVAIYTILGSASIVTPFTVFDNHEFKIGMYSKEIVPDIVYINNSIISAVPSVLINIGLFDIVAHAVESYISKSATDESKKYAIEAMKYAISYIDSGMEDIKLLINADIFVGLSERVGLVLLPHAAGHYLTYKYNIPHGIANMYFLKKFVNFIKDKGIFIPDEAIGLVNKVERIYAENFILTSMLTEQDILDSYNLTKKYMPFIFENNPVELSKEDYLKLL